MTITAIPKMMKFRISAKLESEKLFAIIRSIENRINSTSTIITADTIPNLPISDAIICSLFYKGVISSLIFIKSSILPSHELLPTTSTINLLLILLYLYIISIFIYHYIISIFNTCLLHSTL
jgi:hypothetical protein